MHWISGNFFIWRYFIVTKMTYIAVEGTWQKGEVNKVKLVPYPEKNRKKEFKKTACRHQFSNNLQNIVICRLWYCCQKQSHSIGTILRCIHLHVWFNISPNIPLVQVWAIAWIGSNHLGTICYLSIVRRVNMFLSISSSSTRKFNLANHKGCPRRGCIAISSKTF